MLAPAVFATSFMPHDTALFANPVAVTTAERFNLCPFDTLAVLGLTTTLEIACAFVVKTIEFSNGEVLKTPPGMEPMSCPHCLRVEKFCFSSWYHIVCSIISILEEVNTY